MQKGISLICGGTELSEKQSCSSAFCFFIRNIYRQLVYIKHEAQKIHIKPLDIIPSLEYNIYTDKNARCAYEVYICFGGCR